MLSELTAFVKPLLEKVRKGEALPEFQQGILFAYSYFSSQPAILEDVSEKCDVRPTPPASSYSRDDSLLRFLSSMDSSEPEITELTDELAISLDPDPNRYIVEHVPIPMDIHTTRIVGRRMKQPFIAHLRENEIVQIRSRPTHAVMESLQVQFQRKRFHGFYCESSDTLYGNIGGAVKDILQYGKTKKAAEFAFVQRNEEWVSLESLCTTER